jgi:hypothetical protein
LVRKASQDLYKNYGCQSKSADYDKCSNYELALMQIWNSKITLNPPQILGLKKTSTVNAWNDKLFPKPVEYYWFMMDKNIKSLFPGEEIQFLTLYEAKNLTTFNNLLNAVRFGSAFAIESAKN